MVFKVDIEGRLAVPPKSLSGKKVDLVYTGNDVNVSPNFMLADRYFAPTVQFKRGRNLGLEEGCSVEFKKSIIFSSVTNQPGSDKLYEIAREIAAFMNSEGGDLYCGVDDDGFVVGIENDLAARLQSFPDWYEFSGTKEQQFTMIGNAVPPMFSYKLAQSVISYLKLHEAHSDKHSVLTDLAKRAVDPAIKAASLAVLAKVIS